MNKPLESHTNLVVRVMRIHGLHCFETAGDLEWGEWSSAFLLICIGGIKLQCWQFSQASSPACLGCTINEDILAAAVAAGRSSQNGDTEYGPSLRSASESQEGVEFGVDNYVQLFGAFGGLANEEATEVDAPSAPLGDFQAQSASNARD
ncbi:hypothetical protein CPB83DRAFT_831511 [Crepidotus variabilis]|uniref:Uncharacterized protein n=1 Tax=Crepidotus variabilis TaxID=179855 RepID=A0A9P6ESQ2_9AGAR|nr:hypothetical protein CPB83DRAFT_831511 [Crepidotus variabilis]